MKKLFNKTYTGAYGEIKHYLVYPDRKQVEKVVNGITILVTADDERECSYFENLVPGDIAKYTLVDFPLVEDKPVVTSVVDNSADETITDESGKISYDSSLPGDKNVKAPEVPSDDLSSSSGNLSDKSTTIVEKIEVTGDSVNTENHGQ